jgi:ubiquinone/menaquinone biosynthesis C-methylase UbiE
LSERDRIKTKIQNINKKRWWGDDFDVRFYLISKLKKIKQKKILDIGGGIGIIISETNQSNLRLNLDSSFNDLIICKNENGKNVHNICASMTSLPFKENIFDVVICASVLEYGKSLDIQNKNVVMKDNINSYPTINLTLNEISNVLNLSGILYVTTPNNAYYNKIKLTYDELKNALNTKFENSRIFFFNTHHKIGKNKKMNLANVIPKIYSKIINTDIILKKMLKNKSRNSYSVSFFAEIKHS